MRRNLVFAALALILLCSVAGCSNKPTAAKLHDYNVGPTASNHSAMEYNGMHDGTGAVGRNGRIVGYPGTYTYITQGDTTYRTLGDTLNETGERVREGLTQTAEDLGYNAKVATERTKNAVKDAVDDLNPGSLRNRAG